MLGYVARRSTDRDLQSLRKVLCEFLDMCSARATDRDLESVSASFSVNAWTCARRSTDRALESVSARFFVRMLGYVLVGQPTVIFRVSSHVKE